MDSQNKLARFSTEPDEVKSLVNTVIDRKYKIKTQLHSSSNYFDVYLGIVIGSNKQVAVKTETARAVVLTLYNEYLTLKTIHSSHSGHKKIEGIPKAYWCGVEQGYNVLVHTLLGPNLEMLFRTCDRGFSLKTILTLGDQMIRRLEKLHEIGYIHRDIKPQNFCMGILENSSTVYLTNLGHAKLYKNLKTGEHRKYKDLKQNETSHFSSINVHLGVEPSRRDDLESLAYILIYLYKGWLPWQGIEANSAEEWRIKVIECKMTTPPQTLCRGMPDFFAMFLAYCKGLKYDEQPDYRYLRTLLRQAAQECQIIYDNNYDWVNANRYNEQDSNYQFKNMTVSFKSANFSRHWDRSEHNTVLRVSNTAPLHKFNHNLVQTNTLDLKDEDDDQIPNDLGISTSSNDLSFPSKPLILRANTMGYGKSQTLKTYLSDEDRSDKPILKDKIALMRKLTSQPLPRINDLEEERNEPEMDVEPDFSRQLRPNKINAMDSYTKSPKAVCYPYNIVIIEENGKNYEFASDVKMNRKATRCNDNFVDGRWTNNGRQDINHNNKWEKENSFNEDEDNTNKIEARTRRDLDDFDEVYEERKEQYEKENVRPIERTLEQKEDKNCQIF